MYEMPLLAVVFSPRSRPWSEIVDAAGGMCRFLWIVDSDEPGIGTTARVLCRFGKVIDVANRTAEEIVRLVDAERPDGITSYVDADLHRQAWLAAALELPSLSVRTAVLLTDKLLQRHALDAAGIPVPRFAAVREPADHAEVQRLCETLTFPMVLKPRDGTACRNIYSVGDAAELSRLLKEVECPSQMILEDQMEDLPSTAGPYADSVSIDTIVRQGVPSHLGVRGMFEKMPPFRASGGFFPANVAPAAISELYAMATASIRALGSGFGYFRTEIKFTPKGYRYICEPPTSAQRVSGITGLDALGELPGVVQVDVHKSVGDPVDWRNGSLDKIFQVTGAVAGYKELEEHYRACSASGFVTYEHSS